MADERAEVARVRATETWTDTLSLRRLSLALGFEVSLQNPRLLGDVKQQIAHSGACQDY